MPNNDPVFPAGYCVNCHKQIPWGVICTECMVNSPVPTSHSSRSVEYLKKGEFAYVQNQDVMEMHDRLWIYLDAKIVGWPEGSFTVKIKRTENDKLILDDQTIDPQRFGSLSAGNKRKYCLVTLESGALIPVEVKTKMVSEMVDGDTGFTEPYAIFEVNQRLYIIASAMVMSRQGDTYKTTRVTKKRGVYEIDRTTIDPGDISFGWPDSEGKFEYLEAKLV